MQINLKQRLISLIIGGLSVAQAQAGTTLSNKDAAKYESGYGNLNVSTINNGSVSSYGTAQNNDNAQRGYTGRVGFNSRSGAPMNARTEDPVEMDDNAIRPTRGMVGERPYSAQCVNYSPEALSVGIIHRQYKNANPADLVTIDGAGHKLHRDAAEGLKHLLGAALHDGVTLTVGSAFRSTDYQQGIISRKRAAGKSTKDIYYLSAPVGYSEHHTGFALDFLPIEYSFERSAGYAWLRQHGAQYGWEQSFVKGNKEHVSYEPWHWKFTGSPAAQAIFGRPACK